jgi:S1-C subfamily serine protease
LGGEPPAALVSPHLPFQPRASRLNQDDAPRFQIISSDCLSAQESVSVAEVIHELRIGIPFSSKDDMQPNVDAVTKKLYDDVSPSVVKIDGDDATGSGFFIDRDGRIATDAHCVMDTTHLTVTDKSGKKSPARIVALDDIDDLAIIQIDGGTPAEVKPVTLGKSDEKPDDKLWGLGHAEGDDHTYISPGYFRRSETLEDYLVTGSDDEAKKIQAKIKVMTPLELQDAKLNLARTATWSNVNIVHGDSGGPLVDQKGKVVGLNDLSNMQSDSFFTPVEKLQALMNETHPKFQFSYKKTDDAWTLTDITRTDGAVRPPYEDNFEDAIKRKPVG